MIGEHADYNDGFVMAFAIEKAVYVAADLRDDDPIVATSVGFSDSLDVSLSHLDQTTVQRIRQDVTFADHSPEILGSRMTRRGIWRRYDIAFVERVSRAKPFPHGSHLSTPTKRVSSQ